MTCQPWLNHIQLGLEHIPALGIFHEHPPSVQGILSLYKQKLEIRVTLEEGDSEEVTVGDYRLSILRLEDGFEVTASDINGNSKTSSFPLQGRGRRWDTSQ